VSDRPDKIEWDAAAYHRLSRPQLEWGQKVLARLPALRGDETILDVGCGSGRLTEQLLLALPRGKVIGIDRSERMAAEAKARLGPVFGDRFEARAMDALDLALKHEVDGVFSTATFHWILDHRRLFEVLYSALMPGGWLLAQCGGGPNLARILARADEVARSPAFSSHFEGWTKPLFFADAESTKKRLAEVGFVEIETSIEPAPTRFAGSEEFAAFVRTVVCVAYLERIPDPALHAAFVRPLVDAAGQDDPPYELDYWRLNLSARRPAR
jgi:trans-aconitate 2-methyltransferase